MKIIGIEKYTRKYYDSVTGEPKEKNSVILHLSDDFTPEEPNCIGCKVVSVYVKPEQLPKVEDFAGYIPFLGKECYLAINEFQGKKYSAAAVQIINK